MKADRHGDASAPVSSVAASVRHLIAASASAGLDAGALEAFRGYVDAAVAAGHGADEISRIVSGSCDRADTLRWHALRYGAEATYRSHRGSQPRASEEPAVRGHEGFRGR
ncbi:hypothetical protein [Mycolicibacterium peregrinum]|uniref:imine reductase family protein n=1 Tax=Mycolicibacterium peregrinum TaxID=43304 RepID=UPI002E8171CF|nr:hypothetical protein [Mycolicibacterium peregrinum]